MTEAEASASPSVFETRDVLRLTGIPSTYLNKFIERGSFGIGPSVRTGRGRGTRRLFANFDIYGIALVWWLFQAGLRSAVIGRVLRDVLPAPRNLAANAAGILLAKQAQASEPQVLVVTRVLKSGASGKSKPGQRVAVTGASRVNIGDQRSSTHVIPVGHLLQSLTKRIHKFRPEGGV
jgi:hypothetical protein